MVNINVIRSEADEISANPGWSLVFGRRKVGKTYIMRNFVPHDVFIHVRSDRSIVATGMDLDIIPDADTLSKLVVGRLRAGKTVVIDEFQRLPVTSLESIATVHPNGRLILTGSSMQVANDLLGGNSPLLGLLRPFSIGQISASDILKATAPKLGAEEAIWAAPVLRDPWTIPFHIPGESLENLCKTIKYVVPGLVGEIFSEEHRALTKTYSSILSLVGAGYEDYREIAAVLLSRDFVKTGGSSSVLPYMANMVSMGLLEATARYGEKRKVYRIPSFPVRLHYYLDSRYGISERDFSYSEVKQAAEDLARRGIEELVADLFVEKLGGRKELLRQKDREIDVLITVRNRPVLAAEVKWGRATKADVTNFLAKTEGLKCRKVLVAKKSVATDEVEVMTPADLVGVASGI
jgi:AAA+ ATPase superfamily predicted ATPase